MRYRIRAMRPVPWRRPCVTEDVGEGLAVCVGFDPRTMAVCEVFLVGRGKASDGAWPDALYQLGVTASRIMQGD